jgi:adenylate cyclase
VIGEPVNEAARLCELAKSRPGRLLATADTVQGASEKESARWSLDDTVTLRGHDNPVQLASPADA